MTGSKRKGCPPCRRPGSPTIIRRPFHGRPILETGTTPVRPCRSVASCEGRTRTPGGGRWLITTGYPIGHFSVYVSAAHLLAGPALRRSSNLLRLALSQKNMSRERAWCLGMKASSFSDRNASEQVLRAAQCEQCDTEQKHRPDSFLSPCRDARQCAQTHFANPNPGEW